MERAALFEEQLGLTRRPSVVIRDEAPPARDDEEPTLTSEEPTLSGDEPTLTRDEPTLTGDEPTLTPEEPTLTPEEPTLPFEESTRELEPPPVPSTSPRISELDVPDFRPHRFGRAKLLAAFGVAAALVIASIANKSPARRAEPAAPTTAATDTARATEPAPTALGLEPSATPVPSVTVDMLPKERHHGAPRSKPKRR